MGKNGALNETAKTLKLWKSYTKRVVERRLVRVSKREKHEREPMFRKVDDFWRNLISYMIKYHIEIISPLPVKPVLLQKICEANIPKKYVVDELALDARYSVRIL